MNTYLRYQSVFGRAEESIDRTEPQPEAVPVVRALSRKQRSQSQHDREGVLMRTALALRNAAAIGFGIVLAATSLAGCGSSAGTDNPNEPITLTINLFGDFGYKDLYTQYQTAHPNITIKENVTDYGTHHQNLQAHLLAGAGTADIEAIEIGQVAGFQPQAAKFVNDLDYGVDMSMGTD